MRIPKPLAIVGFLVAATLAGCSDDGALTDPENGGPDFERELQPGEYQVSVTGDVERGFEATGASWAALGDPPFTGWNRVSFFLMGDPDALDGAAFDLCDVPAPATTYAFDAVTPFSGCPSDPGHGAGGFIVQLGAPQADELDCYPNGYGDKDFAGVLTITAVTTDEIEGEAEGTGTCSRHPHSEIEPMGSASVSIRIRFRAERRIP
jgi:hypothetical protein